MAGVVRYMLDDGTQVRFEVEPGADYADVGTADKVVGRVKEAAQPAIAAARSVLDLLEESRPDEAEVTFSVKVSGDTNWIVAKAATEGTLQIRLLWKNPDGGGAAGE